MSVSSSIPRAATPFLATVPCKIRLFGAQAIMANGNSPLSFVRILVVDDFGPWRQQVCSMLETRPEIRVVAEAGDGLEAVQKAQKLNPDLILLDIGLPNLNGLEAAKRICQVAPDAKIVFLTQNRDRDVVQAALSDGARGYILKVDAWSELLPAVDQVVGGNDFLSSGIERSHFPLASATRFRESQTA